MFTFCSADNIEKQIKTKIEHLKLPEYFYARSFLQQTDEKPKAHLEDLKHRMQTVVQGKEELRRQLEQQEKQIGELKNELKEKSARLRLMEKATDELESINEELSEKVRNHIEVLCKVKKLQKGHNKKIGPSSKNSHDILG